MCIVLTSFSSFIVLWRIHEDLANCCDHFRVWQRHCLHIHGYNVSTCLFLLFSLYDQNVTPSSFRRFRISVDTFLSYLHRLGRVMGENIEKSLPERFAILSGNGMEGDSHYVALFATFPAAGLSGYVLILFVLPLMGNENSMKAGNIYSLLKVLPFCFDQTM